LSADLVELNPDDFQDRTPLKSWGKPKSIENPNMRKLPTAPHIGEIAAQNHLRLLRQFPIAPGYAVKYFVDSDTFSEKVADWFSSQILSLKPGTEFANSVIFWHATSSASGKEIPKPGKVEI
jgi:hypothetical protein